MTSRFDTDQTGFASTLWNGRKATRLSNGVVELTALTGGGHFADLRFSPRKDLAGGESQSRNVLWEAPWATVDPNDDRYQQLVKEYGPVEEARLLACYTGHALCMDYFGAPSAKQSAAGMGLHGEAGVRNWNVIPPVNAADAACGWNVHLPEAQLKFEREIRLGSQESVVYIKERVTNERSIDHSFHWVQHATFGPPFLDNAECSLIASAQRGITSRDGYEGVSLLAKNSEFDWPYAPPENGQTAVDLRIPFSTKGRGCIAGIQMDPHLDVQYILAVNWKLRIGVGYCFRRQDFPWMVIWEENCSRIHAPWNGRTLARGMEFGTTPLPVGPDEIFPGKKLFDSPVWCTVPANGTREARYLIFMVNLPAAMQSVEKVEVERDSIRFYDTEGHGLTSIPAHGCEAFLATDNNSK